MSNATDSLPQLLVVEDDPDILAMVLEVLQSGGYGATAATSLPDAQRILVERLFDFILTDLFRERGQRHPLQSIRPLIERAAPIPIGVMTAWNVSEDDPAMASVAFVLHKPFELDDLLGKVDAELHPTIRSLRQHALVEDFFQTLNARDVQRLARLCRPDLRVVISSAVASILTGLPSYITFLKQRWSQHSSFTIEDVRIYPRPDGIAARYLFRWQGSDGKERRESHSLHFRFRHGRISHIDGSG